VRRMNTDAGKASRSAAQPQTRAVHAAIAMACGYRSIYGTVSRAVPLRVNL
jgi:hypothetical protein